MAAPALLFASGANVPPTPEFRSRRRGLDTRNPKTIVVVDDEPWARLITARILRESGYTVLEAGSGLEALDLVESLGRVALVLADIAMPGMDGVVLADTIHERDPRQRVAFLSAYGGVVAKVGMKGPPLPILEKPIPPEELARRVEEIVRKL
jgi:two-component system cell cycle sensor histidine kinase/response regulator CckA